MLQVDAYNMTHPTDREVLQLLLDAGSLSQANIKRGKDYRNVVIFQGKNYEYNGTDNVNKI